MYSSLSVDVAAPPELVFRLARDVEQWPRLLPHYLRVRVLGRHPGGAITAEMVARRPLFGVVGIGLPVVWRARVWAEPDVLRLRFHHVGGATSGMDVTWRIERTASGCRVSIDHEFRRRLPVPVLGTVLGVEVIPAFVDRYFTRPIARRTLATFAGLAEALAEQVPSDPPART